MQQIAKRKYGLVLLDPDLPQSDIDETVAIMDLLQNFTHFVTNYCYFSQGYLFIEKASDSKKLHVIRLEDFKTALRKHGVGILPTAINAAYQFIRNKIQTFLSFLSEETVRCQVLKYLHEMEANKSSPDGKKKSQYKASWAANVLKNLARHQMVGAQGAHVGGGSTNGGSATASAAAANEMLYTYFDKFRLIITQVIRKID